MDRKVLVKKIETAFQEPEKVAADEYQKIIETNAAKASENVERLTFMLLGFVTVMILVVQGKIKKMDLGFVEIDDPSIILIALPVLIAYIQYDLLTTLSHFDLLSFIHKIIIGQRHPPVRTQRLTRYFLSLPTLYEYKYHSKDGMLSNLQSGLWFIEFFVLTAIIPFGSEIIAFSKLSNNPNPEYSYLLLSSMVIAIVLNIQSVLTIAALIQKTEER